MSDRLKNPSSLFDVRGKVAVITGAFGVLASRVLAGAGALLCKSFGERVIPRGQGGKLVNLSSARGKHAQAADYTAYCASKAAATRRSSESSAASVPIRST
jgi:hypothetical protein